MKRFWMIGLVVLFSLLLLLGGATVYTVNESQTYGKLINFVGIVRGATQRLIKLELANQPSDELVEYLDGIVFELNGGEGPYGLPSLDDENYRQDLAQLTTQWEQLKDEINAYREDHKEADALLSMSEDYFEQANNTVFAADEHAASSTRVILTFCIIMFGVVLVAWLLIFWAMFKKARSLESTNKELNDKARRDPLTGAYHLDAFKEEAQRLLDTQPGEKYAVVYTDFVDFKYINDVFGYDYGDSLLKEYGKLLHTELRENELFGRVSADNFVLLLRYASKAEVARRQRVVDEKIMQFMHEDRESEFLTSACGICCVEDVIEDLRIEGILDRANFARKTVKNGTNPNYVYYDKEIRLRLVEEKAVESKMLGALERHEFQIYYQPKVELKSGKIGGAEALVRWCTEEGELISPNRFIPVFERKFMINRLDQYVFEEVCKWLRCLLDNGKEVVPISVNVSRLQFYDQDFVNCYVGIRDRYRIPPELLEIEFTESVVIDNSNLSQIVERLKQAGFSCSIDDFGKGYSSLSLLKNLPIDVVKIDRFFFSEGTDPVRDMAVVQGIIEMMRKFHVRTVAEGIESEKQVEQLKQIGCDYVQGYVFYRPMPPDDFENLLG